MQMKLYGFTKFRNPYANTLLHKVAMENTNDHVPRSTAPRPRWPRCFPAPARVPQTWRWDVWRRQLLTGGGGSKPTKMLYKNVGTTWQNGTGDIDPSNLHIIYHMLGDEYPFLSVTNGYWGVKTESARFLTHTQIGNVSENVWHSLPKRSLKKNGWHSPFSDPGRKPAA